VLSRGEWYLAKEIVVMFDFGSLLEVLQTLFQDFFTFLQEIISGLLGGVLPGL
jgi:hypothetical protein